MYYNILCLWLLSYTPASHPYFVKPEYKLIQSMIDVMQKISREKILRVACATFKNLSENHEAIEVMVDCGLLRIVDVVIRGNIKDNELKEDLEFLG